MTDKQFVEKMLRIYTHWTLRLPGRFRPYGDLTDYGLCHAVRQLACSVDQYYRITGLMNNIRYGRSFGFAPYWWRRGDRKPRIKFLRAILSNHSKYFDNYGKVIENFPPIDWRGR